MLFKASIRLAAGSVILAISSLVNAQSPIQIGFVEFEDKESYSGDRRCEVTFSITNVSAPGTIDRIRIKVKAVDDRGRDVKAHSMQAHVANKSFFEGYTSIPVGSVYGPTEEGWFEEECQYIEGVAFVEVKKSECAIRMLPEDANCASMVGWQQ